MKMSTDRQHQVIQQELGHHDGTACVACWERIRIHGDDVQKSWREVPRSSAFDQLLHPRHCHQVKDQGCRGTDRGHVGLQGDRRGTCWTAGGQTGDMWDCRGTDGGHTRDRLRPLTQQQVDEDFLSSQRAAPPQADQSPTDPGEGMSREGQQGYHGTQRGPGAMGTHAHPETLGQADVNGEEGADGDALKRRV